MLTNSIQFVEMEITSRCNAECPGCPRTQILRGDYPSQLSVADVTLDDVKMMLPADNFKPLGMKLCGNLGDPIMNPQCLEIAEYILSRGFPLKLNTNGGVRTETFWSDLGKLSQRYKNKLNVIFAVDGLEDTNHIYRVNVKWPAVIRNMTTYTANGGRGEWHFIPFDHNFHQTEEARGLAERLKLKFVLRKSIRNLKVWTKKDKPEVVTAAHEPIQHSAKIDYTNLKTLIEVYENDRKRKPPVVNDAVYESLDQAGKSVNCYYTHQQSVLIDSNKRLWPCCMFYDSFVKAKDKYYMDTLPDGDTWNSLIHHSMEEVLQHEFFTDIIKRWSPYNSNFTTRCLKDCGKSGDFRAHLQEVVSG